MPILEILSLPIFEIYFHVQVADVQSTPMSSSIIEMRQYTEEANINRKRDDPLNWWKAREMIYPRLAKLAKKYLSIVGTSVPSERVFSKAGQVVSDLRISEVV